MFFLKNLKKIYHDNNGQHSIEGFMLVVILVVFIAAALHALLPYLGKGFLEMAKTVGGPTP